MHKATIGLALVWAGCGGDKDPECPPDAVCTYDTDAPGDADADADADADTDADADADADADTDTDTDADTSDTGGSATGVLADLSDCVLTIETDLEANGSIDATVTRTYDGNGLEVLTLIADTDPNTPAETTITYDGSGNTLTRDFDVDGNGTIDLAYTFTWSPTGNLTSFCSDDGDDGSCEREERISYDPVTDNRSLYELDNDGDGTFETTCTYVFDGSDRRTSYDCTGGIVQSADYTYAGVQPEDYVIEIDFGSDGSVNQIQEYLFDAAGRLIFLGDNQNAAGPNELESSWTFDGVGNLLTVIVADLGSNPDIVSRSDTTYDVDGYITNVLSAVDVTGDGIPDAFLFDDAYTWNCPP